MRSPDKTHGGQEDRLLNNITISQCILKSIYAIIITQGITNELHPLSGEAEFPQGANAPRFNFSINLGRFRSEGIELLRSSSSILLVLSFAGRC